MPPRLVKRQFTKRNQTLISNRSFNVIYNFTNDGRARVSACRIIVQRFSFSPYFTETILFIGFIVQSSISRKREGKLAVNDNELPNDHFNDHLGHATRMNYQLCRRGLLPLLNRRNLAQNKTKENGNNSRANESGNSVQAHELAISWNISNSRNFTIDIVCYFV